MQYIATNVKSNIRELEGSLNKLIALHKLKNEEINIMLAAEALKDIVSPNKNRQITPELILEVVSEHFSVSIADLKVENVMRTLQTQGRLQCICVVQ